MNAKKDDIIVRKEQCPEKLTGPMNPIILMGLARVISVATRGRYREGYPHALLPSGSVEETAVTDYVGDTEMMRS